MRDHDFCRFAGEVKGCGEIDVQHPAEFFVGGFQKRFVELAGGVVDQDVDGSEMVGRSFESFVSLPAVGDVTGEEQGLAVQSGGGRPAGFAVAVQNDDSCALGDEEFRDGAADSVGAAGDDGAFLFQFHCEDSLERVAEVSNNLALFLWKSTGDGQ